MNSVRHLLGSSGQNPQMFRTVSRQMRVRRPKSGYLFQLPLGEIVQSLHTVESSSELDLELI